MIKINLLNSVTERPQGIAVIEKEVGSPRTQTTMLALVIASLLALGIGYDFISSRSERDNAQKELENQQRIAAQMAAINKEQAELEKKTKDIQARIDAIQKLRSSQKGPVAVLKEVKERIDGVPGLFLASVEQKGGVLVIKGNSPNEAAVTRFGRSLEFSSGLFTNLNIETQRKTLVAANVGEPTGEAQRMIVPETVDFTIKCSYTPPSAQSPAAAAATPSVNQATNQLAQR